MPNWTEEQKLAIEKEGSNIIVSAGAGSGKTAVLTERVINKLRHGIDINHLLVLTFTNAAAAEMKDRIRVAIKKEKMYNQLDYIDAAYITTFDSYAQSIVRKYHYLLNISSSIKIIDDTVIGIITNNILDSLFEENYGNPSFDKFVSCFCEKDDLLLKKAILSINNKLDLKSNKEEYLDNYLDKYYNDLFIDQMLDEYEHLIIEKKDEIIDILNDIKQLVDTKFYISLSSILEPLLLSKTYEEIKASISNVKFPKLPNGSIDDLKDLYSKLKDVVSNLIELCFYTKDELKINLISTKDNIKVIIDIIKELSNKLDEYKNANESYTFNDIAKMAIKIVKDNDEVRNELKQFYNEIMVDEYQDTSDLQEEFISLISNNNVYMVGDIKQSIYRFRHANPEIFRNKYNSYAKNIDGYKIDLLKNFRSREEVLKNINEIFDSIMDEKIGNAMYFQTHRMVYGNKMYDLKDKDANYNMEIINYNKDDKYKNFNNDEIEAFIIANDIKSKVSSGYKVIDKDTKELRNVTYGDFCIIMDRGTAFETFSKIFEYLSIPVIIWQDNKLNGAEDISILKNIVNLIIKIKKDEIDQEFKYYFTSIARSYLFEYTDQKIFDIFKDNNFIDDQIYKICLNIANQIDNITNKELIEYIIRDFKIYEKKVLTGDIDSSIIRYDIFTNLFDDLAKLGFTPYDLPLYFKNSSDIDIKYSLNTKNTGSVNIMNIHKSKGLEFSICYFAGYTKKFNNDDIKNNFIYDDKYGIIIPFYDNGIGNTFLKELYKDKYIKEDISERIRLFYVSLTRVKEKIIIVTPVEELLTSSTSLIPDNIRLNYKSFSMIINSLYSKLKQYIVDKNIDDINLTKDYDLKKKGNKLVKEEIEDKTIEHRQINVNRANLVESHFSKVSNQLYSESEIDNMEYGTYMHYLLETTDFYHPETNDKKVLNFIKQLNLKDVKIYKEYEFIYEEDNNKKHGIIDLMLEYSDHIDIIDYKLKHTDDENYIKQVTGYKDYIASKTGKIVNTYLYSILDEKFAEIK